MVENYDSLSDFSICSTISDSNDVKILRPENYYWRKSVLVLTRSELRLFVCEE